MYDGAVTSADLEMWGPELEGLFARLRPLFYRTESKKHAEQYVRGLLSPLARKNGWRIAEHVGEPEPTPLQRFLNLSPWDADALLGVNREYAMEHLAEEGAILGADTNRISYEGNQVGRGAVAVHRNARADRQLSDRHVPRICHARAGPGLGRPATVPAERILDGRPGPLRGRGCPARPDRKHSVNP